MNSWLEYLVLGLLSFGGIACMLGMFWLILDIVSIIEEARR